MFYAGDPMRMTFAEFRRLVTTHFGSDLAGLTPEAALAFVARTREQCFPSSREAGRFLVEEQPMLDSYDHAVRLYLGGALALPPDQAAMSLWLHGLEQWAAEAQASCDERFADLFRDLGDDLPDELEPD